jgi:DNA polymerase III delta prime subunit
MSVLNLDETIKIIENDIRTKNMGKIKDPELLLSTLKELNAMIGLETVKKAIAVQVIHLIGNIRKDKKKKILLNAVLAGPPGVGKSELAVIYAKIMFALGYLNEKHVTSSTPSKTSLDEIQIYLTLFYLGTCLAMILIRVLSGFSLLTIIILISLILIVSSFMQAKNNSNKTDLVTIVNGAQLKGQYVGWTAKNVIDLCKANAGKKVIFIDEAYTIMTSHHDHFGMEALTALNQFMSENPESCIVVFAGYRDLLNKTIFKYQPGLESRVSWNFDCEPYTYEELSKIYIDQLNRDDMILENFENCKNQIKENYDLFSSQGRSTARLKYFTNLTLETHNFQTGNVTNRIVTPQILEAAIKMLKSNQGRKTETNNNTNNIERILEKFQYDEG